jgi:hypothetical protein
VHALRNYLPAAVGQARVAEPVDATLQLRIALFGFDFPPGMVAGGLNIAATRKEMVRAEMGRRWLKPSCRPDSLPGIMTMESNFQQTGLTPSRPSIRYAATYSTAPRASNADHNIQIVHCAFQMLVRILPMPCL